MKKILTAVVFFTLVSGAGAQQLETEESKILYTVGRNIAASLAPLNITPAELDFVLMGISDAVKGGQPKANYETYTAKITQFVQDRQKASAEKEKGKNKSFIEKASKEKGAVVSKTGLVYIPVKKGTGNSPKPTDVVKVHYHGTFPDGKVFDSSVQRNTPATFPLNGVIPCWTEGLQKIKTGGKAKLICPSDIAYGDAGRPPQIPGGATLIFEVELLGIETAQQPPKTEPAAPKKTK